MSLNTSQGDGIDIPPALLNVLVDLYFDNFFHAPLLLHRPSFSHDLATASAKRHVVLSVCALASRYVSSSTKMSDLLAPDQLYLIEEGGLAQEWAEQAGKLVFAEADHPCEDNVVTSIHLALFWYSLGHWQRMIVHEGNGAWTSRLLGLDRGPHAQEATLNAEMSRRRCWAAFIVNQYIAQTTFSRMDLSEFEKLPLPCDEKAFISGEIPADFTTMQESTRTVSFYAELIRVGNLWCVLH